MLNARRHRSGESSALRAESRPLELYCCVLNARRHRSGEISLLATDSAPGPRYRVLNARRHRSGEISRAESERAAAPVNKCSTPEGIGAARSAAVRREARHESMALDVLNARRHRSGESSSRSMWHSARSAHECSTPEGIGAASHSSMGAHFAMALSRGAVLNARRHRSGESSR